MTLLAPFLAKKKAVAADAWGVDSKKVAAIFDPLVKWIAETVCHTFIHQRWSADLTSIGSRTR